MNTTIRTCMMVAALVSIAPTASKAQGLMSGTGLQPSTQVATPPDAPAIDRPGAEQKTPAQKPRPPAAGSSPAATHAPAGTATAASPRRL